MKYFSNRDGEGVTFLQVSIHVCISIYNTSTKYYANKGICTQMSTSGSAQVPKNVPLVYQYQYPWNLQLMTITLAQAPIFLTFH